MREYVRANIIKKAVYKINMRAYNPACPKKASTDEI